MDGCLEVFWPPIVGVGDQEFQTGVPVALRNGLVAYYALEEASGNRADAGPNGLAMTPTNNPGNAAGFHNNALSCVGASSQYLSRPSSSEFAAGPAGITIAAWVNFTTTGTMFVFAKTGGWQVFGNAPNLSFRREGQTAIQWGSAPTTGAWYQVVGWWDAVLGTVNISVNNGTPVSASQSIGAEGAGVTCIGAWDNAGTFGNFMNGLIDELAVWNRPLSAAERLTLWNAGAGKFYPF